MELSQFTDYALRVLIYTGMRERDSVDRESESVHDEHVADLPSVREIAEAFQISQNHLVKVVHRLGQLGYVHTYRGRGGGIALAMEPAAIGIGAVVRQTENLAVVECLSGNGKTPGSCCIAPACELKRVLARARDAFLASLDACTLDDLLKPQNALVKILRPTPPALTATATTTLR